jgi:hypothetical protein
LIARGTLSGLGSGTAQLALRAARWRQTLSDIAWLGLGGSALLYLTYLMAATDQFAALLPKVTVQPDAPVAAPVIEAENPADADRLRAEVTNLRRAVQDLHAANEKLRRRLAELQSALGPTTGSLPGTQIPAPRQAAAPAEPRISVTYMPLPRDGFGDTRLDASPIPIANGAAPTKTLFAIAIAEAKSSDSLRRRWLALKAEHGELLDGLEARQIEAAGQPKANLRLLAGPFANAAEAARLCARFKATNVTCTETVFEGEKL